MEDSDEEIELFEQERYSQITLKNLNSLRSEVSPEYSRLCTECRLCTLSIFDTFFELNCTQTTDCTQTSFSVCSQTISCTQTIGLFFSSILKP